MEERERRVLEKHRKVLVSDIADVEPILDHLVGTGVFRANHDNVQLVRSGTTPLMRARKLLDILPSRSGGAVFRHFVDALRSAQRSHLAEMLELSLMEIVDDAAACSCDATDFNQPTPSHPTASKLQEALRTFHRRKARRCQLFDFQSSGESVGLDEVFVALSTLDFREVQSMFSERKRLSAERIRELASKTWSERRENVEEITDLKRLLQLSDGKQADGTLLLAQAAGGKTLTLLKIASLWAEGREEFLEQFEFVFYVSGRDEDALKGTSAIDVLRLDQFDLDGPEQAEMAKYLSENSDKVLVLLDGADEGGDLWMKSNGLEKIFERKGALRNCSFVVSSRPCEAAYRLIPVCDQHFHLVGLNDQHLEELLVRRLGEVDGRALAEELKLAKWSQLRALMKETPMIANMVAALRTDGQPLPSTRTELYTVMVVNMVKRATAKSKTGSLAADRLDDLPAEEKTALLNIGQVALKGLKRRRYVFDLKKEVRSVCGDTVEYLGFLEEFRTVSVRGERHEVQFCHLTYQEYLAAYFVSQSSDVENELQSCFQAIGKDDETIPFWRFVGGLLGREKVKVLMSFLSGSEAAGVKTWNSTNLLFQMRCFAEAMEQPFLDDQEEEQSTRSAAEAAEAFLPSGVDLSQSVLSLSDTHALAVSLAHSSHVIALDLSCSNLNSEHCQVLSSYGGVQHLQSLDLSDNQSVHGSGLAILAGALGKNGQLQYFDANECNLDINDCAALKHILITNENLSSLYLGSNTFSSQALRLLQPALASSQLVHLDLRETGMDAEGARVIGEVLSTNCYFQTLYLSSNPLGNGGAASVLRGVKEAKSLTSLLLDNTGVDDGVMPLLTATIQERTFAADHISSGQSVTVSLIIALHGNSISEMALRHLCRKMPRSSADQIECGMHIIQNGEIRQRDLSESFTKYTEEGGEGDLTLSDMGINAEGIAQITAQLGSDCCPVEALELGSNSLHDDGTSLLAESLRSNSTLCGLGLDYNCIGSRGFAALSKVLVQVNTSLQWLELCNNPLFDGSDGLSAMESRHHLGELLTQAVGLKYLGLEGTGVGDEECPGPDDRSFTGNQHGKHNIH